MLLRASKPNLGELADLPNPSLMAQLHRNVVGDMSIVETPFSKHNGHLQHILNEWLNHLESIKGPYPGLWKFEVSKLKKAGPLSCQKPLASRLDDVKQYFSYGSVEREPIAESAKDAVLSEFSRIKGKSRIG